MSTRLIHTRVAARVLMSAVMLGGAAILTGAFSAPAGAGSISGTARILPQSYAAPCTVISTNPGPLTFTKTGGSSLFSVSPSGVVSFPDVIPPGNYAISGTVSNGHGDWGIWRYDLNSTLSYTYWETGDLTNVNGQILETHGTGTVVAGQPFTDQITVSNTAWITNSSGVSSYATNPNPVTYITTGGTAFTVSSSGAVSAPSTLTPGTYIVYGTDSSDGPSGPYTGVWGYVLTVTAGAPLTTTTTTLPPAVNSIGKAPAAIVWNDSGELYDTAGNLLPATPPYGVGWIGTGSGSEVNDFSLNQGNNVLVGHFIACKARHVPSRPVVGVRGRSGSTHAGVPSRRGRRIPRSSASA